MKKLFLLLLFSAVVGVITNNLYAQPTKTVLITGDTTKFFSYGTKGNTVEFGATDTSRAAIRLPRVAHPDSIKTPRKGMIVYCTVDSALYLRQNFGWQKVGSGGSVSVDSSIYATRARLSNELNLKQATLVSGTNIKTLGGNSLLGSGDFEVISPLQTVGGIATQLSINQATNASDGYLSSTDWNTFNNKKNAADSTTTNPANYVTQYQRKKTSDSLAALIAAGSGWSLTGNSGTTAGTNFIGTTDGQDLVFKYSNVESGRIGVNTSYGVNSLRFRTTGIENVAIGEQALFYNTSGSGNTAIGLVALNSNTTGSKNTGVGYGALGSNINVSNNIGIGYLAGNGSTLSNRVFINSLDRTDEIGDTTKSILYGYQAPHISNQKLRINGHLQINDRTQGSGKVFTSDANGVGSWQTPSGGSGGGLTGLTTGGILFGGSLGNAVQNSTKLYLDSVNNYVGIGTNTPGATLHIKPKASSLTPVIIDSLGTYTNTGYAKLAGVPGNGLFKTSTGVLMIRPAKPAMATIDTLVYDDFNRTTLGSNYDTTGSGFTTVLSGGKLTLSTSTSNTNIDRFLRYKGYGYSTMRSFKTTIWYRQPTARASSTYGAVVGAYSMRNPGQKCTSVGVTDFSTNFGPALNHFALSSTGAANIVTSSTSGIPAMSTTNLYRLDFEVKKDSAYTTLTNVTAGTSKVLSYKYNFTSTGQDATKPNFFYYAFGINNGLTNATTLVIDSFLVTTTEKKNVDIVFVGNSITTGYYGGTADSAFAEKLKTNTTKTIQILAGGYNQSVDAVLNLPEILNENPDTAFFCLGTNDISGSVPTATTMEYLATIYTSCINNGTFPVFFTVPNGGNTLSGGGLNQSIAAAYPSNYVDLWTLFFNAYPGEMVDSVHPNAAGMRRIQGIIKAAYPSLFPL